MKYKIYPYRHEHGWVFDDPEHNLSKEGLVRGADELLDYRTHGATKAEIIFSDEIFEGSNFILFQAHDGAGGHFYMDESGISLWLCPNLKLYFEEPPKRIYYKMRSIDELKEM